MHDPTPMDAIAVLVGLAIVAAVLGGAFTLGVMMVGRWLKWTPIKIVVIVHHQQD